MLFILSGISTPLRVTKSTTAVPAKGKVTCVKLITLSDSRIILNIKANKYEQLQKVNNTKSTVLDISNRKDKQHYIVCDSECTQYIF